MLHPGVGRHNEIAGKPRPKETATAAEPSAHVVQAASAVEEGPEEGGLEEKGEHAFHGERLTDDTPAYRENRGPVGTELEFHRDAGHHP